jgi:peptidoglycan/LPS O-acetylase OafA/YrhL
MALLGGASYALYLIHPMGVHAMHLLWNKLGLPAHASETVYFFVTLTPLPVLAVAIYLCFEKPVTKALQVRLQHRLFALRWLSPVGAERASKYVDPTKNRGATAHVSRGEPLLTVLGGRRSPRRRET